MEIIGNSIKGIYRDILKNRNNHVIFDSGWVSNCIVNKCRQLLAAFLMDDQSMGIQYLAMGRGLEEWDIEGTTFPDASLQELVDPEPFKIYKEKLTLAYLENDGVALDPPTNILEIIAELQTDEPLPPEPSLSTYPLREFGLFGQYHSTPYMINCIRHPVIHKDVSTTLIRTIRLYL